MTKLCIDCAHVRYDKSPTGSVRYECHREAAQHVNPVNGLPFQTKVRDCVAQRALPLPGLCGPQGKFWVRRPPTVMLPTDMC